MMRKHTMDIVIDSDQDLTRISCQRIQFSLLPNGAYQVSSTLRFWRCERHSFLYRLLKRRLPGLRTFKGNASAPTGYFWTH